MGTEIWIISLPLSDSILYLKIIHPPNFREELNHFATAPFAWGDSIRRLSNTFIYLCYLKT